MISWVRGGRMGNPTRHLFHVEPILPEFVQCEKVVATSLQLLRTKGEPRRRFVSILPLASAKIDRARIEPTRGPCLEPSNFKPKRSQTLAHRRDPIPHSSSSLILQTYMQQAAHERSGRDDHRLRIDLQPERRLYPFHLTTFLHESEGHFPATAPSSRPPPTNAFILN